MKKYQMYADQNYQQQFTPTAVAVSMLNMHIAYLCKIHRKCVYWSCKKCVHQSSLTLRKE